MLYRNIENSDDNRKVKQVVEEQEQNQFKSALFGETFADFAFLAFSWRFDLQKALKIAVRESLPHKCLITFQFAKVYPVFFLFLLFSTSQLPNLPSFLKKCHLKR